MTQTNVSYCEGRLSFNKSTYMPPNCIIVSLNMEKLKGCYEKKVKLTTQQFLIY